jgi:hypothetical protein
MYLNSVPPYVFFWVVPSCEDDWAINAEYCTWKYNCFLKVVLFFETKQLTKGVGGHEIWDAVKQDHIFLVELTTGHNYC